MRRNLQLWRCLAMAGIAVSLLALVATPAMAQVKIRFQTWHWGEKQIGRASCRERV